MNNALFGIVMWTVGLLLNHVYAYDSLLNYFLFSTLLVIDILYVREHCLLDENLALFEKELAERFNNDY